MWDGIWLPLGEAAVDSHTVDWWIVASNFTVGLPTMILAFYSIREAHRTMNRVVAEQGRERRAILRLMRIIMTRRMETPVKHKRSRGE